jgi:hypothetical protein
VARLSGIGTSRLFIGLNEFDSIKKWVWGLTTDVKKDSVCSLQYFSVGAAEFLKNAVVGNKSTSIPFVDRRSVLCRYMAAVTLDGDHCEK